MGLPTEKTLGVYKSELLNRVNMSVSNALCYAAVAVIFFDRVNSLGTLNIAVKAFNLSYTLCLKVILFSVPDVLINTKAFIRNNIGIAEWGKIVLALSMCRHNHNAFG